MSWPLHPLVLEPIFVPKPWGGRTLASLGKALPGDAACTIGESWELADLAVTSMHGAGGGPARSRVAAGPLAGKTLAQLIAQHGPRLIGQIRLTDDGGFPLLLKFLDARETLSVQVHPRMDAPPEDPAARIKPEAWYILDAAPGAALYTGLAPGMDVQSLRAAILRDDPEEVARTLLRVPVRAGDCYYLPSGTVHALGGGLLVAEVQAPSDTTYRLYDWGRPRTLHLAEGFAHLIPDPPPPSPQLFRDERIWDNPRYTGLVRSPYFHLHRVDAGPGRVLRPRSDQCEVWMMLSGLMSVEAGGIHTRLTQGQTAFIPAAMSRATLTVAAPSAWLVVTFPGTVWWQD